MDARKTYLVRSLTNGAHTLPVRANSADEAEREAHNGEAIVVGPDPTPVALSELEAAACRDCGHVEVTDPAADAEAAEKAAAEAQAKAEQEAAETKAKAEAEAAEKAETPAPEEPITKKRK